MAHEMENGTVNETACRNDPAEAARRWRLVLGSEAPQAILSSADLATEKLAAMGAPCFACTPDLFPELMAAAIKRNSLEQWAAQASIVRACTDRGSGGTKKNPLSSLSGFFSYN